MVSFLFFNAHYTAPLSVLTLAMLMDQQENGGRPLDELDPEKVLEKYMANSSSSGWGGELQAFAAFGAEAAGGAQPPDLHRKGHPANVYAKAGRLKKLI
jgi:hypothetical protein